MTILDVLKIGFGLFLAYDFIRYLRSGMLKRHWSVFSRRSAKDWARALVLVLVELAALLAVIGTLIAISPKILGFSWLTLLAQTPEEATGTNLMIAPATIPWLGIGFFLLLGLNIPRLARREEEMFRRGTTSWKDAVPRSARFGAIHMIVGVPIAAAIGLMGSGLFFTWRYFVGGTRDAAFYHTIHNFILLSLVGVYLLVG
jgi:hypothetical protein